MRNVLRKVHRRPSNLSRARSVTPKQSQRMTSRRTQLQLLWDLANATLAGNRAPSPQQLEAIRHALSLVPLSELGIAEPSMALTFPIAGSQHSKLLNSSRTSTSHITYLHIYEDANFSLGIFILPASSKIPLHNHPGMTVFSRVLYGTMHVRSFDWVDPSSHDQGAVLVHDRAFTPGDAATALFPTAGGNIHQFEAITDCAVLDLLSPPYATEEGRDCTYYQPMGSPEQSGRIVLQEYEPPDDFQISSEPYRGVSVCPALSQSHNGQVDHLDALNGHHGQELGTTSWGSPASNSPRSVTPPPEPSGLTMSPDQSETTDLTCTFEKSHLATANGGRLRVMEGH